ncbi:hypothetical protein MNEG_14872 [Monoraphidium neglectum]|uniref:Uncharacterized protein n=1 Tax=Monoraphidium neglectum TaxID=145388 RepID=A0A0D2MCZ3_9CHLO|nr:hypothetical protein MNEG_14872 [Monoraphidium neglectum]KIY93090.1 hypothetical protein MNEG_14872 [Monoraphidium neglectum]|eukprot:XP_013892110.1 hypothetical protein MNEG_14872 [Monoraphidium neglectum]
MHGWRRAGDGIAFGPIFEASPNPRPASAWAAHAVLVAWRSRRATAIRLLAPFLFLLLALIINAALEANNASQMRVKDAAAPGVVEMGAVPSCHQDLFIGPAKECVDFVFTPTGDRDVDVSGRARDGRHLHDKDTADFAVGTS